MLGRFSGRNSLAFVGDDDQHVVLIALQGNADHTGLVHGLNRVEQQVQQHLVDLICDASALLRVWVTSQPKLV